MLLNIHQYNCNITNAFLSLLEVLFNHEVCLFLAALFDSYGHMINPDTKCLLVKQLAVYIDAREKPDIEIIDGSMLSHAHAQICQNFTVLVI